MKKWFYKLVNDNEVLFISVKHIIRLESKEGYTVFHFSDGGTALQSGSIKQHFERLRSSGVFARINRSHAVNYRYIKRIVARSHVELRCATELSFGKGAEAALLAMLAIL